MSSSVRDDLQSFFAELHRRSAVRQRPARERRIAQREARVSAATAPKPVAVAPAAADTATEPVAAPRPLSVLVVGGVGGMITAYREVVKEFGFRILYREARALRVMPQAFSCLVLATTISHTLAENVATLARKADIPVMYLRNHSITALRRALEAIAARRKRNREAR